MYICVCVFSPNGVVVASTYVVVVDAATVDFVVDIAGDVYLIGF